MVINYIQLRVLIVFLIAMTALAADAQSWSGTWSATTGTNTRGYQGSWTANASSGASAASGTWQLRNETGATTMAGSWSARKDQRSWQGSWQARAATGQDYSGTWRTTTALPDSPNLSELFQAALKAAVNGSWQIATGARKGAWAIRVYRE